MMAAEARRPVRYLYILAQPQLIFPTGEEAPHSSGLHIAQENV